MSVKLIMNYFTGLPKIFNNDEKINTSASINGNVKYRMVFNTLRVSVLPRRDKDQPKDQNFLC